MPIGDDYLRRLLDHLFGKATLTAPALHAGLSTTTPTPAGGNITEPVGGSYARVSTPAGTWGAAAVGALVTIANAAQISWPTPTGAWGTLVAWTLHTAASGGSYVGHGRLLVAKQVVSGTPVNFPIGKLVLEFGNVADSFTE